MKECIHWIDLSNVIHIYIVVPAHYGEFVFL